MFSEMPTLRDKLMCKSPWINEGKQGILHIINNYKLVFILS